MCKSDDAFKLFNALLMFDIKKHKNIFSRSVDVKGNSTSTSHMLTHGAHVIYWFSYSHLSVQNSHYTVLPLQPSQSTWKRQVRYVDLQQSRITRSQKGTSRTTCLLLWLHFRSACRPALAAHAVPDHILNTDWSPAPMRDVDFHTPQPPRSAFSHTAGRPPLPHARNRSFLFGR